MKSQSPFQRGHNFHYDGKRMYEAKGDCLNPLFSGAITSISAHLQWCGRILCFVSIPFSAGP